MKKHPKDEYTDLQHDRMVKRVMGLLMEIGFLEDDRLRGPLYLPLDQWGQSLQGAPGLPKRDAVVKLLIWAPHHQRPGHEGLPKNNTWVFKCLDLRDKNDSLTCQGNTMSFNSRPKRRDFGEVVRSAFEQLAKWKARKAVEETKATTAKLLAPLNELLPKT